RCVRGRRHFLFYLTATDTSEISTLSLHDALPIFAFTGTVDGSYDFYTRALDKAGNYEAAPLSADTSTLVDTLNPTSSAGSPAYSTSTSFSVSYSASDPLKDSSASALDKVELWAKTPGGSYVKYATDNSPGATGSFAFTGTVDGSYDFYTRAPFPTRRSSELPLSADTSTLVDTQDPNTTITFPENNHTYSASEWAS